MAKIAKSYTFNNATLYRNEDGSYILTEYTKDDSRDFDFSQILEGLIDQDGLSIVIKQSADLIPGSGDVV